ncbi:unnamed protein product [Lepeophtheirus salmonis]|uniref:(salmon louse) hypothetical protein n=1 Tax=Lepeophtheirus salmonis TaxID=72036 RepID=A0A7R8CK28_LEPSM|nr:unnamed protein product [Lepeophtheirus salmonis]CAF2845909.1 unnamed protein product [Lepeophtheirus salmonis]
MMEITMEDFEHWLSEACQFLSNTKGLKEEVNNQDLPTDVDSNDSRIAHVIGRYNKIISDLAENYAKAETLCICWNKLDSDMAELTTALNSGGAEKLTMERLESSLAQLKEMFAERTSILANLTKPEADSSVSR